LQPSDLEVVVSAVESGREVIAPSSDGGTSALSARAPIEFAYGSASFHRHLTRLTEPMVVIRPGLLQDIDSPQDLTAARSHPAGAWLRAIWRS
jgi:2-phospho-L-lactate guanylyltransferase (CobY/MobA/RfbA family)